MEKEKTEIIKNPFSNQENEQGGKTEDFFEAIKDEAMQSVLENPKFKDIVTCIINKTSSNPYIAQVFGGIIAGAAPRLNGIILNFREKRFESNVMVALNELNSHMNEFEKRLSLTEKTIDRIKKEEIPFFLDSLYDEKQEEKVKYHVSIFENSIEKNIDDSILIDTYENINKITVVDIEVMKLYIPLRSSDITYVDIMQKHNLDERDYNFIRRKLFNLGFIDSKNEDLREDNMNIIIGYLKKLEKNKKNKPQEIKLPKFNRITNSEKYTLSAFGKYFLELTGILHD